MEAVTVSGDVENGKNMEEDGCFKRGQQAPYIRFNNNCLYEMEDRDDGAHMFASDILSSLELPLSAPKIPDNMIIRPLRIDDYKRGYLQLLSQLTFVGDVSEEQYRQRFLSMQSTRPKSYYVVVIEELSTRTLVGSATLVIEWKFIHEAGCRGRTEDVVVDKRMRGKQLGKLLNIYLVQLARRIGVYKMSLECKDALIPFYGQVGFKVDEGNNFLVQRFA
uniref:Glucosamine 6-phosphate N-acetyltransferase n=2 Tax=Ascaris TaxID=6251 RepID=A0A0M3HU49_ASCLU